MLSAEQRAAIAKGSADLPLLDLLDAVESIVGLGLSIEVWVWDYQRRFITGVRSGRAVAAADIDDELAPLGGLRTLRVLGEDVGRLTVVGPDRSTADGVAEAIDATIAGSIRVSTTVSDDIVVARQHQPMTLAAELQRRLLPPDSFTSAGVAVSAAVEPAYDTGGDVFDYAIDGRSLFLAVLDARGHGLQAATTATVATSALRRARRTGADLVTIATEVAVAVNSIGIDHDFVSAVLVDLDLTTGSGRSLTAGHLPPLIVDGTVQAMPLEPTLPLGLVVRGNQSEPVIQDFQLQHGQSLVLYSDGIIENAAQDDGIAVGDDRFQRALLRHIESTEGGRHLARSVVEELLAITGPRLRDDATLMITTR